MATLIIKDYFDSYNDFANAGSAVAKDSAVAIERNDSILFDMKGLDAVSTVFLNTSFGYLMDKYGIDRVRKSFRFSNILRSQAERIKKYFSDYAEIHQH